VWALAKKFSFRGIPFQDAAVAGDAFIGACGGHIVVWDLRSGEEVGNFWISDESVDQIALYSTQIACVLSGGRGGILDLKTGTVIFEARLGVESVGVDDQGFVWGVEGEVVKMANGEFKKVFTVGGKIKSIFHKEQLAALRIDGTVVTEGGAREEAEITDEHTEINAMEITHTGEEVKKTSTENNITHKNAAGLRKLAETVRNAPSLQEMCNKYLIGLVV
jgi:hypothetical protein